MAKTTPLRYPGGKARLLKYFQRLIAQNELYDCHYVEPFCGGAALAVELLQSGHVASVHINDYDRAVYAFWHSVVNRSDDLCQLILDARVDMPTWYSCREVYRDPGADLLSLGFATFFLNRTNRSGILTAGVIGGVSQAGAWKLDARFNRDELIRRIQRIAAFRSRIKVSQLDAAKMLRLYGQEWGANAFVYLDPPYVEKGPRLYLNAYEERDHRLLAEEVSRLKCPWVVSYDDNPLVRDIYSGYRSQSLRLHYSAREHSRVGREVAYFAPVLVPPDMSGVKSSYRMPWVDNDLVDRRPVRRKTM